MMSAREKTKTVRRSVEVLVDPGGSDPFESTMEHRTTTERHITLTGHSDDDSTSSGTSTEGTLERNTWYYVCHFAFRNSGEYAGWKLGTDDVQLVSSMQEKGYYCISNIHCVHWLYMASGSCPRGTGTVLVGLVLKSRKYTPLGRMRDWMNGAKWSTASLPMKAKKVKACGFGCAYCEAKYGFDLQHMKSTGKERSASVEPDGNNL